MAHEAVLKVESSAMDINSYWDPQLEPHAQVRPLRAWTKSPHMGLAVPNPHQISRFSVARTQGSALEALSWRET